MTLVVARKSANQIAVVSDTKLTDPINSAMEVAHLSESVIKTTILSPDISVSFAGGNLYAQEAMVEIGSSTDMLNIKEILLKHHIASNDGVEFILCKGGTDPVIYQIKNGISEEVTSSWIGDQIAFSKFQEAMNLKPVKNESKSIPSEKAKNTATNSGQPSITFSLEMNITEAGDDEIFSAMSKAMDIVINDESIKSVGGFKVLAIFKDAFEYKWYAEMYRDNTTIPLINSFIIGHGSAQEGAYSVHFMGGSKDYNTVALHIQQGNLGIIYKRSDFGLLKPEKPFNLDEVDFTELLEKEHDLKVSIRIQAINVFMKYFREGEKALQAGQFEQAIILFDKARAIAKEKEIPAAIFWKGIAMAELRNPNAINVINEAIKIDPSYYHKYLEVMKIRF